MTSKVDDPNHPGNRIDVSWLAGDVDLAKTLGLELLQGRLLDNLHAADTTNLDSLMGMDSATAAHTQSRESAVITAYTAKALGVRSLNIPMAGAFNTPVGIVRDFNRESLRKPQTPAIIIGVRSPDYGGMLIRTFPGHENDVMAFVAKKWHEFFPDKSLEINRVTDLLDAQYRTETGLHQLFTVFSGLSMFLAAFGLLGLIIHATEERRKEIGIRKVLGAPVSAILRLFSADFLQLIVIAVVIASPIAWWLMSGWLRDFAYRIAISPWVFVSAGLVTAAIAFATISLQTVHAARANPAETLRTE